FENLKFDRKSSRDIISMLLFSWAAFYNLTDFNWRKIMSDPETVETVELEALKARLKATWMAGDFGQIAQAYVVGAAEFVDRLDLRPGEKLLDVACGTGNLAIPAARAGAVVTGIDIASNLIEEARQRAEIEGVECHFEEGDAEAMPYRN